MPTPINLDINRKFLLPYAEVLARHGVDITDPDHTTTAIAVLVGRGFMPEDQSLRVIEALRTMAAE